jgi:hypothetical protein
MKSIVMGCCSKSICEGCNYANQKREWKELVMPSCPFCRTPAPATQEQSYVNKMKRVKANDPVALCSMGVVRFNEGDYITAFEYYTKAARLGDAEAHFRLSNMYRTGEGLKRT